jgi:curved DNA-binding protein CbpA
VRAFLAFVRREGRPRAFERDSSIERLRDVDADFGALQNTLTLGGLLALAYTGALSWSNERPCTLRELAAMQPPLPAPSASGAFVKTPFPHLLVYALERALTGTFELQTGALSAATITVIQGCPAKVRTNDPVHYLGDVMVELGMITPDHLRASHQRMQESPRLQGQILLELGVIDPPRLEFALRAQVERKIGHLFALSPETTFAYFDGLDILQRYGGPPTPIDPLPVLWRGVKEAPAWEHVDATLRRLGAAGVRLSPAAQVARCGFVGPEQQAIELLGQRPLRVIDLTNTKILGPSVAQILIYFLMITKQVDLVDTSSMRPPAQPAHPGHAPSGRMPAIAAPPASSSQAGQAFARVQLQPRQVSRTPLVVEEHVAPSGANDERVSSPGMKAPVAGPPPFISTPADTIQPLAPTPLEGPPNANPMDIGAMITQTIASSLPPPPIPGPPATAIPAPAAIPGAAAIPAPPSSSSGLGGAVLGGGGSGSGSMPAVVVPGGAPRLTAEQNALKMKIVERADQITGQNYFQMLGLDEDASPEAVQKAFFNLAKVWHPDRLPGALADVKDACSKVFSHLTEAHATLSDPKRRQEYMTLLKEGGATPDDQAKIQIILEAATEFQKAEILLKRNPNDSQAYEFVKRAVSLDPEQVDYMALLTWLDAQLPQWQSREKTLEKISVLDKCVQRNPNCERAVFYRGMLYKRIDEAKKALADFKKVAEMNPRNLDAVREVRLHNMRGGTKPPPGAAAPNAGRPNKPKEPETLGGLFGKLFKK